MEQKIKLNSGENSTSEKNNYTSYNNISNCKNNFFSKIKNKRVLHLSSPQEQKNEIKTKTKLIKKNKLQTKPEIKKSFSFIIIILNLKLEIKIRVCKINLLVSNL